MVIALSSYIGPRYNEDLQYFSVLEYKATQNLPMQQQYFFTHKLLTINKNIFGFLTNKKCKLDLFAWEVK